MHYVFRLLKESKNYILFATLVFSLGAWIGYNASELFEQVIAQTLDRLKEVGEHLGENKNPLYTAWFIFSNNSMVSVIMILMGIFIFFLPLMILFTNGLAVGYVLKVSALQGISPLDLFIYGLMPHGSLELPAIMIAGGIGLFLGIRLWKWLFFPGQFFSHLVGSERHNLREFWQEKGLPILIERSISVILLVFSLILLLAMAACIETFITPHLIENFITKK